MLKLITKIVFIIFLAFLLSIGVDTLYRHKYHIPYQFPTHILPFPARPDPYELVGLGNSHAQAGFTFTGYKVKSLNLASVAQSFEYDLAMLKMHTNEIKPNAIIILTASPLSFSQKTPKQSDYINMNYYDGRLSPFLIPYLKVAEYLQIQIAPFTRSGFLWREQYAQDSEKQAMNTFAQNWVTPTSVALNTPQIDTGSNPEATRSGATLHVASIEAELSAPPALADERLHESMLFMTNKWLHTDGFGTQYFERNRKDLEALIEYSKAHHWRVVLITFPLNDILTQNLPSDYLERYLYGQLRQIDLRGVDYFDFSTNTPISHDRYLFANTDHLNERGASVLSYLLLQKLIEKGYLPKSADGYDYTQGKNSQ
jgi:hypothetical protein